MTPSDFHAIWRSKAILKNYLSEKKLARWNHSYIKYALIEILRFLPLFLIFLARFKRDRSRQCKFLKNSVLPRLERPPR